MQITAKRPSGRACGLGSFSPRGVNVMTLSHMTHESVTTVFDHGLCMKCVETQRLTSEEHAALDGDVLGNMFAEAVGPGGG